MNGGRGKVLIADVQRAVADLYGLPLLALTAPDGPQGSRERCYARPRQVAMFLSRKMCSDGREKALNRSSLTAIGRRFGGRDHSTVFHGVRTIERLIQQDSEERRAVGQVGLMLIERAL